MTVRLMAGLVASAFLVCCAHAAEKSGTEVEMVNRLESCLDIVGRHIERAGETTKILIKTNLAKPVGDCGCMSRLISFHVLEIRGVEKDAAQYERGFGLLVAPEAPNQEKTFEIPLKCDAEIKYTGKLAVEISCKPPD